MNNIWKFNGAKNIKLTAKNGSVLYGDVAAVFDVEETYDEEDSITIVTKEGKHIGFFASEVKSIEYV